MKRLEPQILIDELCDLTIEVASYAECLVDGFKVMRMEKGELLIDASAFEVNEVG